MSDQFGNFANDVSNLQQQLTPAQIARILGAGAQSAVSGVAGMPGDLSNMFAGQFGNQPSQTALPTYAGVDKSLSNYTGLPTASALPAASDMPGLTMLRLAAQAPHIFGQLMQNQSGQAPANQPPTSGPSWLAMLLSGKLGSLTGTSPAY